MRKEDLYSAYVRVLHKNLTVAMGCTEPIAIAYAAAVVTKALGEIADKVIVEVSGNIIKNAKGVIVPNTNGKKGIEAACAAGIIAGDVSKGLEVIAKVSAEEMNQIEKFLEEKRIVVKVNKSARIFEIKIYAEKGKENGFVWIADRHTNIIRIEKNGKALLKSDLKKENIETDPDEELLTIERIFDFASNCFIEEVKEVLDRQINLNHAIAQEGLENYWGVGIGKVILNSYGKEDVRVRAKAYAAAGSDARMSGCEMPVVINSGSGNQGITVSVPIIEYAKELNSSKEMLYRALILANLVAIRQKTLIGFLSAYCGVITAGSAAGAGIAYLQGGDLDLISHVLVNSVAILSGTICDGAKPSCAAKIASAVDAAILGYEMALAGKEFKDGEGIVKKGVENTIKQVGRLGKEGMRQTDMEIIKMMTE